MTRLVGVTEVVYQLLRIRVRFSSSTHSVQRAPSQPNFDPVGDIVAMCAHSSPRVTL